MKIEKSKLLYPGIVASMLIWGLSWPSGKILTAYASPLHIALSRFGCTFLSSLVLLSILKIPLKINQKGVLYLIVASLLMTLYSLFFFTGIQHGMPGAGGVLVTTMTPIFTYIVSIILAKRKPTQTETIGLLLGIIASSFLLNIWTNYDEILQSGNIYFLLSCITWTFLSRITARSQQYGSPMAFSLWMYLVCSLFLSGFANFPELFKLYQQADHRFWVNLIFNAVINTGMATTFYFFATSKLGAARTSSFIYIVPFAAAFFSWLIIDEKLVWNTIVGGTLGIVAVWVLNRKEKLNT